MPLCLSFLDPGSARRRVVSIGRRLAVGSRPGPDGICVSAGSVHPVHAEIEPFDGVRARIRCARPDAAVFVNGWLRENALLGPGDRVQLGGVELLVISSDALSSTAAESRSDSVSGTSGVAPARPAEPTARAPGRAGGAAPSPKVATGASTPAPKPTGPAGRGTAPSARRALPALTPRAASLGAAGLLLLVLIAWSVARWRAVPAPRPRKAIVVTTSPPKREVRPPRPVPTRPRAAASSSGSAPVRLPSALDGRPEPPPGGTVQRSMSGVVGVLRASALGSGFIVTPEGHFVTNAHVVGEEMGLEVKLHDGRRLPARWVAEDRDNDLAVFRIEAPADAAFTPLPLGNASDIYPGAVVYAFGFPLTEQLGFTATRGIVSALRTFDEGPSNIRGRAFVQHDAAINPGNSGGPLVNARGRVVGVNNWKVEAFDRIGFAIPVDAVTALLRKAGVSWSE